MVAVHDANPDAAGLVRPLCGYAPPLSYEGPSPGPPRSILTNGIAQGMDRNVWWDGPNQLSTSASAIGFQTRPGFKFLPDEWDQIAVIPVWNNATDATEYTLRLEIDGYVGQYPVLASQLPDDQGSDPWVGGTGFYWPNLPG